MARNPDPRSFSETPGMEPGEIVEAIVNEKHPRSISESQPSAASPISYLYLTFDSLLPSPRLSQEAGLPENQQLSPAPDLRPYMSPLTWAPARKIVLLTMSCLATFLTAYTAGAYSPPSAAMAKDLGASHLASLVGITTFCLGFGLAPMALAPISEIWGRYPVFVGCFAVYAIFQAVCPLMTNLGGMLVARFFVGAGASVAGSVVGGVIADLWDKEERNTPMAIFSGCVLLGTGAGPLVASAFVERFNDGTQAWKWSFWHQVIMDGLLVLGVVVIFRESRGSVLLSRKAKKLNRWYEELESAGAYGVWVDDSEMSINQVEANEGSSSLTLTNPGSIDVKYVSDRDQRPQRQLRRIRWLVQADEERASLAVMMHTSIRRPFHLLFTEPVVFWFSLWAAFSWGILYLSFAVVPFLYAGNFEKSSRIYIAMMVSSVVACIAGIWQDRLLRHPQWQKVVDGSVPPSDSKFWALMRRKFPAEAPESRLYFSCITAMMLPAGLFGAFMCPPSMAGYGQAIGIGFANWGIYSIYLATFNYLADTYHVYASSALAAQSFSRNMLGGAFPLITGALFTNMGLKGAGGILGGIACALTLIPWVLVFFGERIRARSVFAIVSRCSVCFACLD
ncbi:hypothetical protein G7046_g2688 [Stylonectria norvegica]|nr:hypothetical protein G7046_g2688 [Stylonectria norvegica]